MSSKSRVSIKRVFSSKKSSPTTEKKYRERDLKQEERVDTLKKSPGSGGFKNLCFTGTGFLGVYSLGVAQCIKDRAPQLLKGYISASSSGALIAVALATGTDLQKVRSCFLRTASQSQKTLFGSLNPFYSVESRITAALLSTLPSNAHKLCSGRLFLSLTRASDYKNELVYEYETRNELIRAVLCCCHLPYISWMNPPTYKGRKYIDGGFTNNMPMNREDTVTIGCFAGTCDISPRYSGRSLKFTMMNNQRVEINQRNVLASMSAMMPPPAEVLDDFYHNGYEDAEDFLADRGY